MDLSQPVTASSWPATVAVMQLLFLGSSCIYPKLAKQPIREEALRRQHGAHLCVVLDRQDRRQHGFNATNLSVWAGRQLPAHQQLRAACVDPPFPRSGTPLREFLPVDDLGEACVFALEHWQPGPVKQQFLNVGTGLTIRGLAKPVAAATGFQGEMHWDASKPDGTPKKQLDVSRLAELGWRARIPLVEGLRSTVAPFHEELIQQKVRL